MTDENLQRAHESLKQLLDDTQVPDAVRAELKEDFVQVEAMLDKVASGHIHIAVFGRVSVGKSSLLNALIGEQHFATSALHGKTRQAAMAEWEEYDSGGIYLIDTPGINEIEGEERERMAHEVANRSDLILFVIDGDMTDTEFTALRSLGQRLQPLLLVLNKCDRYSISEREEIWTSLRGRTGTLIDPQNMIEASADPPPRTVIMIDQHGNETETERRSPPQLKALKNRLWDILEADGQTLSALNASLFAGDLSDRVAERILAIRSRLGEKLIRTYSLTKGVAVAINPIPVADLLAVAMIDISMVVHLSKLYGLPLNKAQSGKLIRTIIAQMSLIMGTAWLIHLIASLLKAGTAGLSTLVTAGAQGAVAYYSTYIVGMAAERYLADGKSWGEGGPKLVIKEILENIDRDSLLIQAREDIMARVRDSR